MILKLKDFKYDVSLDYNSEYYCEEYGCDQEGICRCGTITDVEIKNVNIKKISDKIYEDLYPQGKNRFRDDKINFILNGYSKDLNLYTIDRILRHYKIWDPDKWDVEICGGYYGEEIDVVFLKEKIANEIELKLKEALSIEDMKLRIEYLLKLEYNNIHPKLIDVNYTIKSIDKTKLVFPSISNKSKTDKEINNFKGDYYYNDKYYDGIKGVVIKDGDNYRVIDGYHRLSSISKNPIVIVAE